MPEELNNPSAGLSVEAAMDALLVQPEEPSKSEDPEGAPEGPEVTKSSKTTPVGDEEHAAEAIAEDADEQEDNAEEEEAPESEEADEDDAEEDSESEESEEDTDEASPEPFMVLEDGTEISEEEAKRGYLRQADYTKKTQELAQDRKQLAQAWQQRAQEREVLAENLNLAISVVEPTLAELAGTDWDRLAREDAYEYAEKRALYDQAQARYNQLTEQGRAVLQQQQQEQEAQRKQRQAMEAKRLQMAFPDLADPTKANAFRGRLRDYAQNVVRLSPQEAGSIVDHRMVILMEKARRYDELQKSGLSSARKKVSKSPKRAMKPGKPTSEVDRQAQRTKQQRANLRRTGTVDAAVAALESMGF